VLVEGIMTSPVVTIDPAQTTRAAGRLMRRRRFRHLPVAVAGRVIGIVSDRDVMPPDGRTIGSVMHRELITVTHDTPVEVAATLLVENKIGAVPVLNDYAELVGIVTETDLFRYLARVVGGGGPGTRLDVSMEDLTTGLAALAGLASRMQVPITSLVTEPGENRPRSPSRVAVRVGTINPGPFVQALRTQGFQVNTPADGRAEKQPVV
jgi:acetoin utilization protein AcuB